MGSYSSITQKQAGDNRKARKTEYGSLSLSRFRNQAPWRWVGRFPPCATCQTRLASTGPGRGPIRLGRMGRPVVLPNKLGTWLIDWCLCVNCEIEMDRWRNKWGRRCIYRRHWCLPDHSGEQRKRERGVWRAMEWLRHKIRKHQMLPQLFTSFLFIPFFIHLLHPPTHISFSFYSRWFIMNTCSLLLLLF